MMKIMPCISLWQPWATLLASGAKQIETRGWYTSNRGRFLIHAARKWNYEIYSAVSGCQTIWETLASQGVPWFVGPGQQIPRPGLPFGAIVGSAELHAVIQTSRVVFGDPLMPGEPAVPTQTKIGQLVISQRERQFGDFREGRFAWVCRNFCRFKNPVPCRGDRGWFEVNVPDEYAVER